MNEQEFGAKIKIRREELGISQNDLAVALKIDQGKVSLIEKGLRRIEVTKELPTLAKALKVPIDWFYEIKDIPKSKDPVEGLIKQYFPDITFTELELRRIRQFLEPMVKNYIELDPSMKKRLSS